MSRIIRSLPFTLVGLSTIVLFLVAEALDRVGTEGPGVEVLHAVLRVLIVPIWLMRSVVVAIGIPLFGARGGFPVWYDVLTIPVLLSPYIAIDLLLIRAWRQPHLRADRARSRQQSRTGA